MSAPEMNRSAFEVAVVVCCFNESTEQITRALQSVCGQKGVSYSIFVIDDSGAGKYQDLVTSQFPSVNYFPVNFHNNAKALNYGISKSQSEFVAILDADDEWIDNFKLKNQAALLSTCSQICAVGTWCEILLPNGRIVEHAPTLAGSEIQSNLLHSNPICHSSLMVRRASLNALTELHRENDVPGPYDSKLPRGKDLDLLLNLMSIGQLSIVPRMAVRYSVNQRGKRFSDAVCGMKMCLRHRGKFKSWRSSFVMHMRRALVFYFIEKLL